MKRVLVAPLDWGLGHTSRCVPIIKELLANHAEVFFAGTEAQISFIKAHRLKLHFSTLEGYNVKYSAIWPQWVKVGFQSLRILKIIEREHQWLQKFVTDNKIDVVISDNRFGLYSDRCKSIFITHQLSVPSPLLQRKANEINTNYISRFDECWVPDHPEIKLSGDLSSSDIKHSYIGLLSRFTSSEKRSDKQFDLLLLLSGTEPQRSILEEKLLSLKKEAGYKTALVRGTINPLQQNNDASTFDLLSENELRELLLQSETVVCRSGYSSLMDLVITGNKLFLIPTPGQPEQEYLAEYLKKKWNIPYCRQNETGNYTAGDIINGAKSIHFKMDISAESERLLKKEISRILSA